jgi:hypothetical protein
LVDLFGQGEVIGGVGGVVEFFLDRGEAAKEGGGGGEEFLRGGDVGGVLEARFGGGEGGGIGVGLAEERGAVVNGEVEVGLDGIRIFVGREELEKGVVGGEGADGRALAGEFGGEAGLRLDTSGGEPDGALEAGEGLGAVADCGGGEAAVERDAGIGGVKVEQAVVVGDGGGRVAEGEEHAAEKVLRGNIARD